MPSAYVPQNESERETEFLVRIISYDDTTESLRLQRKLADAQKDERCVQRAVRLTAPLLVVAAIGFAYCEVLLAHDGREMTFATNQFIANSFYGLGLGSVVSLLVLAALGAVYRRRTCQQREESRRFAVKILQMRLGHCSTWSQPRVITNQENIKPTSAAPPDSKSIGSPEMLVERCVSAGNANPA